MMYVMGLVFIIIIVYLILSLLLYKFILSESFYYLFIRKRLTLEIDSIYMDLVLFKVKYFDVSDINPSLMYGDILDKLLIDLKNPFMLIHISRNKENVISLIHERGNIILTGGIYL